VKTLFILLAFILIVSAIVGCTPSKTSVTAKTPSNKEHQNSVSVTQHFEW